MSVCPHHPVPMPKHALCGKRGQLLRHMPHRKHSVLSGCLLRSFGRQMPMPVLRSVQMPNKWDVCNQYGSLQHDVRFIEDKMLGWYLPGKVPLPTRHTRQMYD
eukprot:PhF_6_TR15912/c0_g1_i1/m.24581